MNMKLARNILKTLTFKICNKTLFYEYKPRLW